MPSTRESSKSSSVSSVSEGIGAEVEAVEGNVALVVCGEDTCDCLEVIESSLGALKDARTSGTLSDARHVNLTRLTVKVVEVVIVVHVWISVGC
jgi:hypothetical protein